MSKDAAEYSVMVLSAAFSFSDLCFFSLPFAGGTLWRGDVIFIGPCPFAVLLPVAVDGFAQVIGVKPVLLVKYVPIGGYYDGGAGSVGVGAPHRLVERAVRVAREVVRKDNLC